MAIRKLFSNILINVAWVTVCFYTSISCAKPFVLGAIFSADNQYSPPAIYLINEIVKRANADGAEIKLVNLINKSDTFTEVIELAKKAEKLHVDAVIGCGNNSEQGLIVSKILNAAKIPLLVSYCSHPDIFKNKPYVFSFIPTNEQIDNHLFKEMLQLSPEPKKVVIIRNLSMQYAIFNSSYIRQLFQNKYPKTKIYYIDTISGRENFSKIVNAITVIKPDILYMASYSPEVSSLLIGLTKTLIPLHIFISGASLLTSESKYYKMILKKNPKMKVYVYSVWSRKLSGPYAKEYLSMLRKKYKKIDQDALTDLRSVFAFDTAKYMVTIIKKYGNKRGLELVAAAKTISFDGITGKFWFDHRGQVVRNYQDMSFIK